MCRHTASVVLTIAAGCWLGAPSAAQQPVPEGTNGRFLFDSYCAPCHGIDGKGAGTVAFALKAAPPDITQLTRRHGGVFPRARVERFVTDGGGDLAPAHASGTMPLWGPTLRSFDPSPAHARDRIASVVGYVETLQTEVAIASATLGHHVLANELFRIGDVWMRVQPDTEFHRWMSRGSGRRASIILATDAARFGDKRGTRVLTGTLNHSTAFGEGAAVHVFVLRDEATGRLAPVTLETTDDRTAEKFAPRDNTVVSVVIVTSDY